MCGGLHEFVLGGMAIKAVGATLLPGVENWGLISLVRPVCVQGNHLEWLGCALYVAGQSQLLQTVEGEAREGNSVSLTQILRATKLK